MQSGLPDDDGVIDVIKTNYEKRVKGVVSYSSYITCYVNRTRLP